MSHTEQSTTLAPLAPSPPRAFIKRHPVLTYYILTFAISWGGMLLLIAGRTGILATPDQATRLLPAVVLVTVAGPSVASLLLTAWVDGGQGFRELASRLLRWRVATRWYAVALLTAPLLVSATLFALLPTSPVFLPGVLASTDRTSLLLVCLGYGLAAGFFEELGWTGFAVPRLRRSYGVPATALIVGIVWGVWHLLSNVWGSGDSSGALSLGVFVPVLVFALAVLPAYRLLMVWVYDHTQSLLVAMLMHASLTASWLAVMPVGLSGAPFLTWYVVLAVALWTVVAAVEVATGGYLTRQPLRTRAG